MLTSSIGDFQEYRHPEVDRHADLERARVDVRARMVAEKIERWDAVREADRERTWDYLSMRAKTLISERLSERKMVDYVSRHGYEPVLRPCDASNRPQGFDAVYERNGRILVCEAKGTSRSMSVESLMGYYYNERQGTVRWALEAANAIERSTTSNRAERRAAERVKAAEKQGRLDILVFVTEHRKGVVVEAKPYLNPLGAK